MHWRTAMRILGPRAARTAVGAGLLVALAGALAGGVRVLPFLLSPGVRLGVALAFARGLVAMAVEVACVCAPAIGWALASSELVDRGEARALHSIGVRPRTLVLATAPAVLGFAVLAAVASLSWGAEAVAPGKLARGLLSGARKGCVASAASPGASQVPLFDATWVCFPERGARLVGALPSGAVGLFSAWSVTVSDDLASMTLEDAHVLAGASGAVRLHAGRLDLHRVPMFARPSGVPAAARSLGLSSSSALAAILSAWAIVRAAVRARVAAFAIGASGPAAALALLPRLEQGLWVVGLVPVATAAAVLLTAGAVSLPRMLWPGERSLP